MSDSKPKSYHPDYGLYRCPECKRSMNVYVNATCAVTFRVDDDGYVMGKKTNQEEYAQRSVATCSDCGYQGLLGKFLMGYRDETLDACPDCEHPMEIPASDCEPNGTPKPDANVFCRECEGHMYPLADWKAKGWRCLESSVVFYTYSRKSCPSCGASVDFVDVTGKARDDMMLCRCSGCTRWWAEPEDGHPDHSF